MIKECRETICGGLSLNSGIQPGVYDPDGDLVCNRLHEVLVDAAPVCSRLAFVSDKQTQKFLVVINRNVEQGLNGKSRFENRMKRCQPSIVGCVVGDDCLIRLHVCLEYVERFQVAIVVDHLVFFIAHILDSQGILRIVVGGHDDECAVETEPP